MPAGKYRHRVTIERLTESKDATGGLTESWSIVATRWARVVPLSGKESYDEAHELAVINARIELRADSITTSITAKDRATWNGAVYDIETPIDVGGLGREIHLMCKQVT